MSAIILVGGKGSRLNQDKCQLSLAGERVLEKTIQILSEFTNEIILVLSPGQLSPLPGNHPGIKETVDVYPGRGPLVGLYSGLLQASEPYSLAVACDMPFLNAKLLRHLLKLSPGFDVVIPRVGDKVEPLHAVYSKNCLYIMQRLLEQGDFKVSNLLSQVRVRYVEGEELDLLDPGHLSFFNINSPGDLVRAEKLFKEQKGYGAEHRGGQGEDPGRR